MGCYSKWYSWTDIILEWLDAKDSPSKMKAFTNLTLGRPYDEEGAELSEAELLSQRRLIEVLPNDYRAVIGTLDVQTGKGGEEGWLSLLITAWNKDEDVIVKQQLEFHGDVSTINGSAWSKFISWLRLKNTWLLEDGTRVQLSALGIDSGAHATTVYEMQTILSSIMGAKRVVVLKGSSQKNDVPLITACLLYTSPSPRD